MQAKTLQMAATKRIALVAHDSMKDELLTWVRDNRRQLRPHTIFATGTTGWLLQRELGIDVQRMLSGPLGGDLQLGALIAEGGIDILVFFWDPLTAQPHDPDVKALLRLAVLWNIPVATNQASADFMFAASYVTEPYSREVPDYDAYQNERETRLAAEVAAEIEKE